MLDIAGQIAESYRALHQLPGSLTEGASAPALYAACIPGSASPGPPMTEGQPLTRDPQARLSAWQPRSSLTGSHQVGLGESQQEPTYHERSTGQPPRHLSQQPGRSTHPDCLPEASQVSHPTPSTSAC